MAQVNGNCRERSLRKEAVSEKKAEITYHHSILELIGHTPLVRLNRIASDVPPTILVKLEMMNPGGSVKDRIRPAMIDYCEKQGLLRPGGTIVEPIRWIRWIQFQSFADFSEGNAAASFRNRENPFLPDRGGVLLFQRAKPAP